MKNNSNITLTENDFSLFSNASEEFTDPNRELLIEIYVAAEYDDNNTAEKIKQQILDNQEIVERLKKEIILRGELGESKKHRHEKSVCKVCAEYDLLKAVLEKQA